MNTITLLTLWSVTSLYANPLIINSDTIQSQTTTLNPDTVKRVNSSIIPTLDLDSLGIKSYVDNFRYNIIDSLTVTEDLNITEFYDSLQIKSRNNFWTKNIYDLLVRSDLGGLREEDKVNFAPQEERSVAEFSQFANKEIAAITLKQVDIFGQSIYDTISVKSLKRLDKISNRTHLKTQKGIIKRNLFFKIGDKVIPSLMAENEKYIRQLKYIRDVKIIIRELSFDPNRVEVTVITQDKFPYGGSVSATPEKGKIKVYNTNTLGRGDKTSVSYLYNLDSEYKHGYAFSYEPTNIFGFFGDMVISYEDSYKERTLNTSIISDYISTESQFAGGTDFIRGYRYSELPLGIPLQLDTTINVCHLDSWIGKSFKLNTNYRSRTSFVIGAKHKFLKYYERPVTRLDTNRIFSSGNLFLTTFAFSKQKLYKGYNIYTYGNTEDIPYGYTLEFGAGYRVGEFYNRSYAHIKYAIAAILPHNSYIYFAASTGGYYNITTREAEQVAINLSAKYFSHVFRVKKNKIRQFIDFSYTKGINRFEEETLSFKRDEHIRGLKAEEIKGKDRISLSYEAVKYHNRSVYGFKISTYIFGDAAIMGDGIESIFKQEVCSGLGLGIRLRNEALVFNTVELRLAYYPSTSKDHKIFDVDLRGEPLSNFSNFLGKEPEIVEYY